MARKSNLNAGDLLRYLLAIAIIVGFVTAAAWGLWVMFIAWSLDRDFDRLIIAATSVFWFGIGGLLWLVPRRRS